PLAVGIPGSVAAYEWAIQNFGKKHLADVINPVADLADNGFAIDAYYAKKLAGTQRLIAHFPETQRILGSVHKPGDILKQPDLAATYRHIATDGSNYIYKGGFALTVADWMSKNGGIITDADFA